jgi:uncharacterized membrane protein YczE
LVRYYSLKVPSQSSLLVLLIFMAINLILCNWFGLITIPLALVFAYLIALRVYRILDIHNTNNDKNE